MTCESNSVEMMFKQECQEVAQEIINKAAALVKTDGPENALPAIVAGLVKYGGWEMEEARELAGMLVFR